RAGRNEAHLGPRCRLDGCRVGHAAWDLIGRSLNRLDSALCEDLAAMRSTDARYALLARLIDHAPMFPPASLGPAEALAADARAGESAQALVLGRLVWPASALAAVDVSERELSAVLDAPLPDGLRVAAVEVRYRDDLGELAALADAVYVEIALDDALDHRLDELAELGLRAKVRCGGAAIPSAEELARFV